MKDLSPWTAKSLEKADVVPTLSADDLRRALTVIEGLAAGDRLSTLTGGPDQPKRGTFYRWVTLYPEIKKAFDAAREISAYSLEDKTLDIAETLISPNDYTGTKVRALEVAMGQLRWSASRRNAGAFGDKGQASMVIPIQINTSLDIGQAGGGRVVLDNNVYDFAHAIDKGEPLPEEAPLIEDQPIAPLISEPKAVIPRGDGRSNRRPKGHTKQPASIKRQINQMRRKEAANGRDGIERDGDVNGGSGSH